MIIKLLSTLRHYALFLVVFYIISITVLSLININRLPDIGTNHDDKLYHASAYFVFVILSFNYLKKIEVKKAVLIAMVFSVFYGIIIEVLQHVLNTNRTFDILDIVANTIGVILGYFIIQYVNKLKLN
ncbi:VanZ family protein [Paucihalobacter sp.]|uniref:VanZ family protein n=1 Tax=Paucihalobacter sp. TaxID=2850405 RepID=UPI002FDFA7C1